MNCHITRPNYAESASSSGNILDLVLTNNDSLIEGTAVYLYTFDSDHFPVYFTVKNKLNTIRKVYCYGKADFDGVRNTLSYVSWDSFISCDDINSSVFQDLVFAAVDQHVPLMKLRRNSRPPGIGKAVMELIKKKKDIWKRLKNNASLELTSKFKFLRKETKKLISSNYCQINGKIIPKSFGHSIHSSPSQRDSQKLSHMPAKASRQKILLRERPCSVISSALFSLLLHLILWNSRVM